MKREDWPKIGTQFYFVCEHLYDHGHKEYVVCSGELVKYTNGERLSLMQIVGPGPDGHTSVTYGRPQEIGIKMFYSAKEAAQVAKRLSDQYDKVWCAMEPPIRRPWANLLEETGNE